VNQQQATSVDTATEPMLTVPAHMPERIGK